MDEPTDPIEPSEVVDEGARQAEEDALCEVLDAADSVLRRVAQRLLSLKSATLTHACAGQSRSCTRR